MRFAFLLRVERHGRSKRDVEGGIDVVGGTGDQFDGGGFIVECVIGVGSTVGCLDPGFDCIAPPRGA